MRILVTGGAGFIGSNFVNRIVRISTGIQVRVLDAFTYAANLDNLAPVIGEVEVIEGNICDKDAVLTAIDGVEAVVNFAAESHNDNSISNPELFYETNVMGTLNLAQACCARDRLHHVSTDEVYGDLPLNTGETFTLDSSYRPSSPYSASKAASDHLIRAWIRTFGLKATISNSSNNYGPNQHPEKLIPATILRVSKGEAAKVYGNGLNVRDWIHVDDHTDGIIRVLERGQVGQSYLFGARNQLSNLEVVRAILAVMGRPEDFIEYVQDRPGHDSRYAIEPSFAESKLDWKPLHTNLLDELQELVSHYESRFGE